VLFLGLPLETEEERGDAFTFTLFEYLRILHTIYFGALTNTSRRITIITLPVLLTRTSRGQITISIGEGRDKIWSARDDPDEWNRYVKEKRRIPDIESELVEEETCPRGKVAKHQCPPPDCPTESETIESECEILI
jgi:hypothetical protein